MNGKEQTDVTSSAKSSDGVRKKRYLSKSMRAGTQFPIRKLHLVMSTVYSGPTRRLSKDAPVFMAAVLECLVAKVISLAGVIAHNDFRSAISQYHLQMSIGNDKELYELLTGENTSRKLTYNQFLDPSYYYHNNF